MKERLFGLSGNEGNHGEDVKEYYFYLDSTPTHSYMKFLYKYPQAEFPYRRLVEENRRRGKQALEFELIDTGVFDDNRYFDVFIEYAKAAPDDILIKIEAINRGPEPAPLHLLPTVWFLNTWSWGLDERHPRLRGGQVETAALKPTHYYYGNRWLYWEGAPSCSFARMKPTSSAFTAPKRNALCQRQHQRLSFTKRGRSTLHSGNKLRTPPNRRPRRAPRCACV